MIGYFFLLCAFQIIGEVIIYLTHWPIPAPVIGMALLFVSLMVRNGLPDGLAKTADFLLSHLALFFVPAGVGVISYLSLLQDNWQPITLALIGASLLSILLIGVLMQRLTRGR